MGKIFPLLSAFMSVGPPTDRVALTHLWGSQPLN